MSGGRTVRLKGRVKEAADTLPGDGTLQREGRAEQLAGRRQEPAGIGVDQARRLMRGR